MKQITYLFLTIFILLDTAYATVLYFKDGREIKCDSLYVQGDEYVCNRYGASVFFAIDGIDIEKMNKMNTVNSANKEALLKKCQLLKTEIDFLELNLISNFSVQYSLGEWRIQNQGLKYKMDVEYDGGVYKYTVTYADGSKKTSSFLVSHYDEYPYGIKFLDLSSSFGEYYVMTHSGHVHCYDKQGEIRGFNGYCMDWDAHESLFEKVNQLEDDHRKLKYEIEDLASKQELLVTKIKEQDISEDLFKNFNGQVEDAWTQIDLCKGTKKNFDNTLSQMVK